MRTKSGITVHNNLKKSLAAPKVLTVLILSLHTKLSLKCAKNAGKAAINTNH